jgi:RNA polymerase sigma-70 factor (ECF subfamily)
MTKTSTPMADSMPASPAKASSRPAGERAAFADLLQQHRGLLAKVVGTYAWQAQDREDLGQEIAVQLWRAWPSYDRARPVTTWMYRIALNVAISWVRGHSRELRQREVWDATRHDTADPLAHDPELGQQVELLYRFIHALPPLERALMLLYLEDRSHREIAEVLGISEANAATKVSRLKQRIGQEL